MRRPYFLLMPRQPELSLCVWEECGRINDLLVQERCEACGKEHYRVVQRKAPKYAMEPEPERIVEKMRKRDADYGLENTGRW